MSAKKRDAPRPRESRAASVKRKLPIPRGRPRSTPSAPRRRTPTGKRPERTRSTTCPIAPDVRIRSLNGRPAWSNGSFVVEKASLPRTVSAKRKIVSEPSVPSADSVRG